MKKLLTLIYISASAIIANAQPGWYASFPGGQAVYGKNVAAKYVRCVRSF